MTCIFFIASAVPKAEVSDELAREGYIIRPPRVRGGTVFEHVLIPIKDLDLN